MTMEDKEHGRYQELIHRALDGTLESGERQELEEHLVDCEECSHLLGVLEVTSGVWKERPDEDLSAERRDEIGDEIMARIDRDHEVGRERVLEPSRLPVLLISAMAVAAAVVLVLVISWGGGEQASDDASQLVAGTEPGPEKEATTEEGRAAEVVDATPVVVAIATASQGRSVLSRGGDKPQPMHRDQELREGDAVTLDKDAKLDLDVPSVAELSLRDGAILEAKREGGAVQLRLRRGVLACRVDRREPGEEFTVVTPAGTVEVKGTVFEVEVLATSEVSVAVAEGKVVVRDAADDRNVVAVGQGERMDFDWSAPRPAPMDSADSERLLALFGLEPARDSEATGRRSAEAQRRSEGPSDWEALFEEALEKRGAGDLEGATEIYEKIARSASKPQRAEAAFALGQISYQRGDYADSVERLLGGSKLFAGTPYETMALFYAAKGSFKLGRCDQASDSAKRFLELSPSHRLAESLRSMMNECSSR